MSVLARWWIVGALAFAVLFAPTPAFADFALSNTPTECIFQQHWETTPAGTPYINVDQGTCWVDITWSDTPDQCPRDPQGHDGRLGSNPQQKRYSKGTYDDPINAPTLVSGGPDEKRTWKTRLGASPTTEDLFEEVDGEKLVGTDVWKVHLDCIFNADVESGEQAIPIIVRGPNYRPPAGGGGPPSTPPETVERIRQLRAAMAELEAEKRELEHYRREMEQAVEELEAANEVFCGTAGSLGMLQGLHAFQWNGFHHVPGDVLKELSVHYLCSRIPDFVKGQNDAEGKLARNAQLIRGIDRAIGILQDQLDILGAARVASRPATSAMRRPPIGGSAKKPRGALSILKSRRTQAVAAIGALSTALGKGEFDVAKTFAQTAAQRLAALPAACNQAKRYLKKSGLGKRFSRSRIIGALRRLTPNSLPRSTMAFARTLHLTRAQMRGLIREAKKVPRSRIKATSLSDLICSRHLDAIDRSLAGTLGKLAEAL